MQVAECFSQDAKYPTSSAAMQSYICHFKMSMDSKVHLRFLEFQKSGNTGCTRTPE